MSDLPTFSVRENTITHENPTVITDGIMVCQEAYIQIDTSHMGQEFLLGELFLQQLPLLRG
jgi:hypothetical protein